MAALVRNEGRKTSWEEKKDLKKVVCAGIFTLALAGPMKGVEKNE